MNCPFCNKKLQNRKGNYACVTEVDHAFSKYKDYSVYLFRGEIKFLVYETETDVYLPNNLRMAFSTFSLKETLPTALTYEQILKYRAFI